jgi:hypothetical protein
MAQGLTADENGQLPGRIRQRIADNIRNAASVEGIAVREIAEAAVQAIPDVVIVAAIIDELAVPSSALRVALDALYAGSGAGDPNELVFFADTDGAPYSKLRSEI